MSAAQPQTPAPRAPIPEFDDAQLDAVARLLAERYRQPVVPEPVEVDLLVDPGDRAPSACPALFWEQRGAQFVVCRTGIQRYRGQFFYGDADQYGTGRDAYADLAECVAELLRVQSDHERERAGVRSGSTATDLPRSAEGGDDYHPPLLI